MGWYQDGYGATAEDSLDMETTKPAKMITESPLNNPSHPCAFCSKPVSITTTYCGVVCENRDEILKAVLEVSEDEQSGPTKESK